MSNDIDTLPEKHRQKTLFLDNIMETSAKSNDTILKTHDQLQDLSTNCSMFTEPVICICTEPVICIYKAIILIPMPVFGVLPISAVKSSRGTLPVPDAKIVTDLEERSTDVRTGEMWTIKNSLVLVRRRFLSDEEVVYRNELSETGSTNSWISSEDDHNINQNDLSDTDETCSESAFFSMLKMDMKKKRKYQRTTEILPAGRGEIKTGKRKLKRRRLRRQGRKAITCFSPPLNFIAPVNNTCSTKFADEEPGGLETDSTSFVSVKGYISKGDDFADGVETVSICSEKDRGSGNKDRIYIFEENVKHGLVGADKPDNGITEIAQVKNTNIKIQCNHKTEKQNSVSRRSISSDEEVVHGNVMSETASRNSWISSEEDHNINQNDLSDTAEACSESAFSSMIKMDMEKKRNYQGTTEMLSAGRGEIKIKEQDSLETVSCLKTDSSGFVSVKGDDFADGVETASICSEKDTGIVGCNKDRIYIFEENVKHGPVVADKPADDSTENVQVENTNIKRQCNHKTETQSSVEGIPNSKSQMIMQWLVSVESAKRQNEKNYCSDSESGNTVMQNSLKEHLVSKSNMRYTTEITVETVSDKNGEKIETQNSDKLESSHTSVKLEPRQEPLSRNERSVYSDFGEEQQLITERGQLPDRNIPFSPLPDHHHRDVHVVI